MTDPLPLQGIYARRFGPDLEYRRRMWAVLCKHFFQRYVPTDAAIVELGAGYCEFINHIEARRRVAVDINPDVANQAAAGVEAVVTPSTDMGQLERSSIDVVFASNFFEHLQRPDIVATLRESARVLKPGGKLLILQPNYRYCYRDYWMFFDHLTPLDDRSLAEVLETSGFDVVELIPRFLPFTTKSRLPKTLGLVKLYLKVPLAWRIFGQQCFAVARKQ